MRRTLVLDVVGLTPGLLGPSTPRLNALLARGKLASVREVFPAVTCTAQASFTTGSTPSHHGVVANGWYFRDLAEVMFWKQSNRLVRGPHVWDLARARDPSFTVAKLFWWFNMYADVDWSVTPRPMYPADGRKLPDIYTQPAGLRDTLQAKLGQFPLFNFWGPTANLVSTQWIADATEHVYRTERPTLTLVYLPHLDYDLQRLGPKHRDIAARVREVDEVAGRLSDLAIADGARVVVLSEYGITEVSDAVHPNRALRRAGLLAVRDEQGRELLDAGASQAFAVADHQIAHVYVKDPARVAEVRRVLEGLDGVEVILDDEGKRRVGLDHARSGELVLVARADRWFTYYYFLDDARAPDYARTVDIHRKPGYDPVELFLDPKLRVPKLSVASRILRRKLGFRTLLDVIPLEPRLVRGSHGRPADERHDRPLFLTSEPSLLERDEVDATDVRDLLLRHIFE